MIRSLFGIVLLILLGGAVVVGVTRCEGTPPAVEAAGPISLGAGAKSVPVVVSDDGAGIRKLSAVLVHPGGAGCSDLAAAMHDGFLVTEVMGQGVNLLTGDYSRGAVGFRIENGQIAYPVEEVTIAGNLRELFAAIEGTGSRIDTRGNIHAGELLIGSMTVAGA